MEQTNQLSPLGDWSRVTQVPILDTNGELVLAQTTTAPAQFYRLRGGLPAAKVHLISLPTNALVPEVVMDGNGMLHLIYGLNHNAYYCQSTNNGVTFSQVVKVNSAGTVETEMGERGPKLALARDGVIHVVWMDDWAPGVNVYVRYSRSLDGGKTFEALKTASSMPGVDGATVAADGVSNVIAFWHVMTNPPPSVPQATWLFLARSSNNGVSFGGSEKLRISNLGGIACSMCMTRARTGADGNMYLAFRNAEGNIRDFYMLKGQGSANDFTAIRVNQDNWNIDYCPMCGPELTFDPVGRVLCGFMSQNKVYWAVANPPLQAFRLHVATPANEVNEIYPSATANRRGEVLFLWQVGPMSTSSTATVKWACYSMDGTPSGQRGTAGVSFSGTKAAAFVGTDDDFYIVTTAK